MVSTLIGYKLQAGNMAKTLERLESNATIKRDKEYYAANIGKVTSVDDFLNDYRLYSYAMKAYGLEDQIASKGLIRKVLESDLSDSSSFANKLTDKKYRSFAAAFSFATNAASETKVAQTSAQETSLVDSYDERRVRQGVVAAQKTNYYAATVTDPTKIRSVDDFLNNTALYNVLLSSVGADASLVSKDFVRQALTGTLPAGITVTNPKWLTVDEQFNFEVNGSLAVGQPAQDAAQANGLIYDYNVETDNNANSYSAAFNTTYYTDRLAAIGTNKMTAGVLTNDKRMFDYIGTAFGFDMSLELPAFFYQVLTSDASDPTSTYSQLMADTKTTTARKEQFTSLRAVFNFDENGNPLSGGMQTDAQQQKLTDAYFRNYTAAVAKDDKLKTSAFKHLMSGINSVTDLLKSNGAFGRDALEYALKAFDIDPDEVSLVQVRKMLLSDPSDPNSYVNKLKDERFTKFVSAFNFDSDGKATTQRLVQSTTAQTATATKYLQSFGDSLSTAKKDTIKTDTKAYVEAIADMNSLDDLLSNKKVLDFALKAYGLDDKKLSTDTIRKILTSDLSNKKSFAYSVEDNSYLKFAQAFNFTTSGTIRRETGGVQAGAAKLTTDNNYLLQTLETKASDEGQEGVRLALYFRRNAPELTSVTNILADKAMLKVVMTALNLPDGFSQVDTDKQVATLEKKLKLADLKDPKTLDKFIGRFASLYDVANADTTTSTNPALQLFASSSSATSGLLALL